MYLHCLVLSDSKRLCLKYEMGFPQVALALNRLPTDVTLKLSDGSIDAHRMILAAVRGCSMEIIRREMKEKWIYQRTATKLCNS